MKPDQKDKSGARTRTKSPMVRFNLPSDDGNASGDHAQESDDDVAGNDADTDVDGAAADDD